MRTVAHDESVFVILSRGEFADVHLSAHPAGLNHFVMSTLTTAYAGLDPTPTTLR